MSRLTLSVQAICALVVCTLIQIAAAQWSHPTASAKLLCLGYKVELTKKFQLLKVRQQLDEVPTDKCPDHVRSAIIELANLLEVPDENLCTVEVTQRIKDFYLAYLDTSEDRLKEGDKSWFARSKIPRLPTSLKKFAIAYGMQVSNACRWVMIEALVVSNRELLDFADLNRLGSIAHRDGSLNKLVDNLTKPGEIVLPSDFAALVGKDKKVNSGKVYIQSAYTGTIRRIQSVCEQRFEPLYEPLIMPVTILGSVGFEYQDKELRDLVDDEKSKFKIKRWSRVVFLCEAIKMVEPVDFLDEEPQPASEVAPSSTSEEAGQQVEKKHARTLKLLTKEEADEIIRKLGEHKDHSLESVGSTSEHLERVQFNQRDYTAHAHLNSVIYDREDSRLKCHINYVKTSRTELGRVKGKIMRRALLTLKQNLLDGRVQLVLTGPVKAIWRRKFQTKSNNDGDVSNALIQQIEQMSDKAQLLAERMEPHEVVECVIDFMLTLVFAMALGYLLGFAFGSLLSMIFAGALG